MDETEDITPHESGKLTVTHNAITAYSETEVSHLLQSLLTSRRTTSKFRSNQTDQTLIDNAAVLRPLLTTAEYKAAIDRAVEAGRSAPNHKRTEPFTFKRILGPSETTDRLADIAKNVYIYEKTIRGEKPNKTLVLEAAQRKKDKWGQIPAYLVTLVSTKKGNSETLPDFVPDVSKDRLYETLSFIPPASERELEDYAAACAATQNVLLSLHAEKVATKWATGPIIQTRAFRRLIHARPEDRVVALIMIGQAMDNDQPNRRRFRHTLEDVLQDL